MIEIHRQSLLRQYGAAAMLESAVLNCPQAVWADDAAGGPPFWRLAYHAMFYLDLYLSDGLVNFRPPRAQRGNAGSQFAAAPILCAGFALLAPLRSSV